MKPSIDATVAVEDDLSLAVLLRVIKEAAPQVKVAQVLHRGGNGYLQRIAPGLNKAAVGFVYILLTDLDEHPCPSELIANWLQKAPRHQNFLLRVAVKEVEAWVLADRESITRYLGVKDLISRIADPTDRLPDPKRLLLELAGHCPSKAMREDLVPKTGSTAKVGPGYNLRMGEFVRKHWRVDKAMDHSQSLHRTVAKLRALSGVIKPSE